MNCSKNQFWWLAIIATKGKSCDNSNDTYSVVRKGEQFILLEKGLEFTRTIFIRKRGGTYVKRQ